MKLRYIITALAATLVLAASCEKESENVLKEVQVSSSYVALPAEGGSKTITLTATDSWKLAEAAPEWLTVAPTSGSAGETKITFTAKAATATQETELLINCGSVTQHIMVLQQTEKTETPLSTVAEVTAGPDSKTYRVKGVVTKISETAKYGNFYLADDTGEVYIYGTKYEGQTEQAALIKLGVEVGDVLTVEGPKTTYNGTVELVDVDVVNITKSLLKVSPDTFSVEKEGGEVEMKVVYKGNDLQVKPQVDWLSLGSISVNSDTTVVKVKVAANTEDTRVGTVILSSSQKSQSTQITVTVTQSSGLAMYTMPYAEDFSKGQSVYEINEITPRADGKAIWSSGSYGGKYYMKASGGSKVDTKSMLISPKISLKNAKSPVLTFEHCGKYCGDQAEELTVWVSTDNCTTWTQLLIPNAHDNAYTWTNSGEISLASCVGKDYVNVAFQYISNTSYYGTWEIANIKVEDRTPDMKTIAEINDAAASTEAEYKVNLTNAVVTYVNGSNAFIEDATAGIQLYKSGHGLTAGQVINGEVTVKVKLYAGYAEATSLDVSAAKVTTGEAKATELTLATLLKDYLRYQNCMVQLKGVTLTSTLNSTARDSKIQQDGSEVAARLQDKTVTVEAGTGTLICFPTRYNTTLQLGVWTPDHFVK